MADQSFLARLGARLGTLGSASVLAFAAPLAADNYDVAAHTSASRIGFYFDRTAAAEKMGFVVMGTERLAVSVTGVGVLGVIAATSVIDSAYGGGSTVRVQGTASDGYVGTIGGYNLKLMVNGNAKATVYQSGGVYIGSAPVDPGANGLTVEGPATAGGLLTSAGLHGQGTTIGIHNTQGYWIGWNEVTGSGANGQTIFRNHRGLGSGGFDWVDTVDGTMGTLGMRLTGPGVLTVYGASLVVSEYTGAYWGSMSRKSVDGYIEFNASQALGFRWLLGSAEKMSMAASGGVFIGTSPSDPGANNLIVQGTMTSAASVIGGIANARYFRSIGDVAYNVSAGPGQGAVGYRVITNGAGMLYPFPFGAGCAFSSGTGGGEYTTHLFGSAGSFWVQTTADGAAITLAGWRQFLVAQASGGFYVGSTPSDPGANNLTVQATMTATTSRVGKIQLGVVGGAPNPSISCWADTAVAGEYHLVNGWGAVSNPGILVGTSRTDGMAFQVANGLTRDGGTYLPNNNGTPLFTVYGSGGVYLGTSRSDPGANNLTVQATMTATTSRVGKIQLGVVGGAPNPSISCWADTAVAGEYHLVNGWGAVSNPGILVGTSRTDGMAFQVANGLTRDGGTYLPNNNGTPLFTVYGSGGVYLGTSRSDPGANNLTVQGTATVAKLASGYTGTSQAFNLDIANTWNGSSGGGILGTMILALNHGGSAGVVANQIVRATYTKNSGAIAAGTTFGASGIELISTFNETETNGFTAFHSVPTVATGKTLNALTAFLASAVGGSGTVTTLRAFVAEAGAGTSQFSDGVYIGSTYSAPGANNLLVQGTFTTYGSIITVAENTGAYWGSMSRKSADGYIEFNASQALGFRWLLGSAEKMSMAASGGVYIGTSPTDPGANNLIVQGVVWAGPSGSRTHINGTNIEMGVGTGNNTTYLDFHSAETDVPGQDYSARILREGGVNGTFGISNTGTGPLAFDVPGSRVLTIFSSAGSSFGQVPFNPGVNNLHVQGNIITSALRVGTATDTSAGVINALSSANGFVRLTGATPDLRGIAATAGVSGMISVWFQFASTIRHQAGTAAAGDKISTNTGADIAVAAGAVIDFRYDSTSTVWRTVRG